MALRRRSSGLTIGQLLSLTVGFLAASVLIFFFGLWVGRDLAQQKLARDNEIIRIPVSSPTPGPTLAVTQTTIPTLTPARRLPTPTPSPWRAAPSATATVKKPTRAPSATPAPAAGTVWSVQASASTDPVEAVVLARKLRAKGYDAYTTQAPIAGVTWYRVQVGKFADKTEAKAIEARLRSEEGLEAAYVTRQ